MVERIFAGIVVDDLPTARAWYERLFNRPPDAVPMSGLCEWHFGNQRLQLVDVEMVRDVQRLPAWGEAGASSVTLVVKNLDQMVASAEVARVTIVSRFTSAAFRTASLQDPAGNLVTLLEEEG